MAVVEIVRFKLAEGVSDEQFQVENHNVEAAHVSKQPGFVRRETAHADDGEWLVVIHWESAEGDRA
jgi:heme-degrading monooxygenase HmoA